MSHRNPFEVAKRRPSIVGTGLIALDVVVEGEGKRSPWLSTGGTCGNVLTILSYFGWQSFPVARLNGDPASRWIEGDLTSWQVRLDYAKATPGSRTPIVVHRISKTANGLPIHRFSWTCPHCGAWLPGYRPVQAPAVLSIVKRLGRPKVFFLDRVSRGALVLAKACRAKGALVFFEPSGLGEPRLFTEALELSHILKYSNERVRRLRKASKGGGPLLEIETLGADGLRYRSRIAGASTDGWERLEAYQVPEFRDAGGAGDWCSAGIIHRLAQRGMDGLTQTGRPQLDEALLFGQALGAWACGFEGARGGMYAVDKMTFRRDVQSIISQDGRTPQREVPEATLQDVFKGICPACAAGHSA